MSGISVVVPLKGHPVLVNDALASVAREMESGTICRLIVVDDGCTLSETRLTLEAWQALLADKLIVQHWQNAGLSAARNRGIAAALAADPELDAIFLLDADNTLAEGAGPLMARLLAAEEADWFYPRFDFFGQTGHYISDAAPNLLFHSVINAMEAGSLVRKRVFERGLRFDEAMRSGYEDWEFWLNAQREGLRGMLVEAPMLQYRKRPVSMLAASHDQDAELRAYISNKHRWLYNVPKLLSLEAESFPRFAVFEGQTSEVLLLTDPAQANRQDFADYARGLYSALIEGYANHTPEYIVLLREGVLEALEAHKLLYSFLWNAERRQLRQKGGGDFDQFYLTRTQNGLSVDVDYPARPAQRPDGIILRLSQLRAFLDGALSQKVRDLDATKMPLKAARWAMGVPLFKGDERSAPASELLQELLLKLQRSPYFASLKAQLEWRRPGGAAKRQLAAEIPRRLCGNGVVLPLLKRAGQRDIAFVLPIISFGGVEKVAASLARVMRDDGWRCHLVLVGVQPIDAEAWMLEAFEAIHWQPDENALDWSGPEYRGMNEPSWGSAAQKADLMGLLSSMDVVVNGHSAALHKIANALRQSGVVMVLHEHVVERSPNTGRGYGPPMLALAYEGAYDAILTCSRALADWLHHEGVPEQKLIPVVNAAGYPMSRAEHSEALAQRVQGGALRVGYIGRFDAQKGMDRLQTVYQILNQLAPQIELFAIGGSVVGKNSGPLLPSATQKLPPLRGAKAMTEALLRLDVLLLPSYFEGLPLIVLEAQRLGVVVVATDVGAMNEAIEQGQTGFIVSSRNCEMEMVDQVLALDADRALLQAVSSKAQEQERDWASASNGFRQWLETRL